MNQCNECGSGNLSLEQYIEEEGSFLRDDGNTILKYYRCKDCLILFEVIYKDVSHKECGNEDDLQPEINVVQEHTNPIANRAKDITGKHLAFKS